ncbi:MAG: thioredoxin-dependent thiol peroxidase [Anaerolineales bacterium]|nr:thioredoxin-dependent thiol peroxidase [Anaerolineales bacterium]
MYLSVGQKAPEFLLPNENGELHSLNDYDGQHILLYFYPKDDTPGCTTEACNFRDDYSQYNNANVVILGVSPDTPASHLKFKKKYHLPFPLLADEGHRVCELYGVWGPKKNFGKEYDGVHRTTYLIDPAGFIKEVFKKVSPANHSAEVLALLK